MTICNSCQKLQKTLHTPIFLLNALFIQVDPKSNKNLKYEVYTFFKRYYSANLMSVCILHNADMEKLEEIAAEKFSLIPNKNIPQTIYRWFYLSWSCKIEESSLNGLRL